MSKKITSPTAKSHGFLWTLLAVMVIIIALIAYIVYTGQEKKREVALGNQEDVAMVVDTEDDHITLKADNADADTPQVDLYEDYSCPHCGDLAEATDDSMRQRIEAGELIVNVHSLAFLDSGEVGHSTKAGMSAEAVAESGDAKVYWNYRKALYEKQREIYSKWELADFAKLAKDMGADDKTVEKIENGSIKDHYLEQEKANGIKLEEDTGKVSSPKVLFNHRELNLVNAAGTGFADWPKFVAEDNIEELGYADNDADKADKEADADAAKDDAKANK